MFFRESFLCRVVIFSDELLSRFLARNIVTCVLLRCFLAKFCWKIKEDEERRCRKVFYDSF